MLEESLLKTNFIGRDGFRWWIGQIAPSQAQGDQANGCLLYTSPSPRDVEESRMPSSA